MPIRQTAEVEPATSLEPSWVEGPCTAESPECTCPDFCERDHANE
jgi:hypothetical protein